MRHSPIHPALNLLVFLLLANACCKGQDFLDENPEFKQLYEDQIREMSEKEREDFLKYLTSLPREERRKFMAFAVEQARNRITVEHIYAKYSPGSGAGTSLSVVPFSDNQQPITDEEIRILNKEMKLRGELRIYGFGTYSTRGSRAPKVRVLMIMQKQVVAPVEFPLPPEGRLIVVQTDNGWRLDPVDYKQTEKKVYIAPSDTGAHRTSVDFDTGSGRSGSDAFGWP